MQRMKKFFGQCNETYTKAFPDHKCQLEALEENELQLVPSVTSFASVICYYSRRPKDFTIIGRLELW